MVNEDVGTPPTQNEVELLREQMNEFQAEIMRLKAVETDLQGQLSASKSSKAPARNQSGADLSSIFRKIDFSNFDISGMGHTSNENHDTPETGEPNTEGNPGNENNTKQNTGANLALFLLQEIQKLHKAMIKIPGMPPPLEEATLDSYADSPFDDAIALMEIPKKFSVPNMKLYDGTTDPQEHVAQYKQRMFTIPIPGNMREACMCKGYGSTLTGPALQWFVNIPNRSIKSFAGLINSFNQQFASSRKLEKQTSDLYRIVQKNDERLRDYLHRFNKEKIAIPKCDIATAIEAFRQGLVRNSELYKELTKYPCSTFEDVQAKTLAQIRFEEDSKPRSDNPEYEKTNRKAFSNRPGNSRNTPYHKPEKFNVNTVHDDYPPLLSDFNLTVNTAELVRRLDNMGSTVKWPRRNDRPDMKKDPTKWCEFHADIGHTTENCIALRKEVAHLLKNGCLKDLLAKPKANVHRNESGPPPPPPHSKIVNFINGGSDICGLTYSAAKRIARENKMQPPSILTDLQDPITFDQSDAEGVPILHHDGLVIKMQIGTCLIKRVMIDGGSSVNIIMLETLNEMGISTDQLTKKSNALVGFSGEVKHTLGEISLPTYADGVSSYENFCVLDCLSSYNVLLGRPWIHNLKAVPSTYHQCVKIPTQWGVVTVKGEQQVAQECYRIALKPSYTRKSGSQSEAPVLAVKEITVSKMETEEIILNTSFPDRKAQIGSDVPCSIRNDLISFLKQKEICFAWSHRDMTGIDPNIITHRLNIEPTRKPVRQKRRKFAPERNTVINEEVDKLLEMKMKEEDGKKKKKKGRRRRKKGERKSFLATRIVIVELQGIHT